MKAATSGWSKLIGKRLTGHVCSMMGAKNFGYISSPDVSENDKPIDVFFHKTAVDDSITMEDLRPGCKVSFVLMTSERGLKGVSVRLEEESE